MLHTRRHALRALLAVLLAFVLALPFVPFAQAHATLVRSDPPANALLATAPPEVHLWFSEPLVAGLSALAVLDSQGRAVQQGAARLASAAGREMAVGLPRLPNGAYLVSWRAFSAVDGHTTVGAFAFSIGVLGSVAASDTASARPLSPTAVLFRWLLVLAQAYVVGTIVFRWWVWEPAVAAPVPTADRQIALPGGKSGIQPDKPDQTAPAMAWTPPGSYAAPALHAFPLFSIALALSALSATGLYVTQIVDGAEVPLGDLITGRVPLDVIFGSRLGTAWIGRMATL